MAPFTTQSGQITTVQVEALEGLAIMSVHTHNPTLYTVKDYSNHMALYALRSDPLAF